MFMIFSDTYFGFDFWWLWLSISASVWNIFCVVSMFFSFLFKKMIFGLYFPDFTRFLTRKRTPKRPPQVWPHLASLPEFPAHLWVLPWGYPQVWFQRFSWYRKFSSRFSFTIVSIGEVKPTSALWPEIQKNIVERLWILIAWKIYLGATLSYFGICL